MGRVGGEGAKRLRRRAVGARGAPIHVDRAKRPQAELRAVPESFNAFDKAAGKGGRHRDAGAAPGEGSLPPRSLEGGEPGDGPASPARSGRNHPAA